jgi:MFS family permease
MASNHNRECVSFMRGSPFLLYVAEAVNSIAGTLLTVGLPFYTNHRFGWGARENFATAACQGMLYVLGALSAKRISKRFKQEPSLLALYAVMTAFACAAGFCATMGWAVPMVVLIAIETGLMGASWPMLESLVSAAGDASGLSRRLGGYNIVWASTGALALAASGFIIQNTKPWGFFGIVGAVHLLAFIMIFFRMRLHSLGRFMSANAPARHGSDKEMTHARPVNETIIRQHKLALWLSRIALPSTYVIILSLAPALPSLHAIKQLSTASATMLASIWFVARAAAFILTGITTFWHRRPILILGASITMLLGFLGTVISGSLTGISLLHVIPFMASAQIVLGFSLGTIYSASLYFGMAVSDGSTEHGGYHEALIGLGQVLGPVVGATTQMMYPGVLWPVVVGISFVVSMTIVLETVAGMRIAGGIGAMMRGEPSSIPESVE